MKINRNTILDGLIYDAWRSAVVDNPDWRSSFESYNETDKTDSHELKVILNGVEIPLESTVSAFFDHMIKTYEENSRKYARNMIEEKMSSIERSLDSIKEQIDNEMANHFWVSSGC